MSDKRKKLIRALMEVTGKSYQWVANRYDKGVSAEAIVVLAKLEAPVRGEHADVVIVDDPLMPKDKP